MSHKIYRFRFQFGPDVVKVRAEAVSRRGTYFTARSAETDTRGLTSIERKIVVGALVDELLKADG